MIVNRIPFSFAHVEDCATAKQYDPAERHEIGHGLFISRRPLRHEAAPYFKKTTSCLRSYRGESFNEGFLVRLVRRFVRLGAAALVSSAPLRFAHETFAQR
jgi:hypothetical protein